MRCNQIEEALFALVEGLAEEGEGVEVRKHLDSCSCCTANLGQMGARWRAFGVMTAPSPTEEQLERMRRRIFGK